VDPYPIFDITFKIYERKEAGTQKNSEVPPWQDYITPYHNLFSLFYTYFLLLLLLTDPLYLLRPIFLPFLERPLKLPCPVSVF
jgi:hypothetical protein